MHNYTYNLYTGPSHLSEQAVESLPALVVLRVHPDDAHGAEQSGQEGRDGCWLGLGELHTGTTQEGDELEAVLRLHVALL